MLKNKYSSHIALLSDIQSSFALLWSFIALSIISPPVENAPKLHINTVWHMVMRCARGMRNIYSTSGTNKQLQFICMSVYSSIYLKQIKCYALITFSYFLSPSYRIRPNYMSVLFTHRQFTWTGKKKTFFLFSLALKSIRSPEWKYYSYTSEPFDLTWNELNSCANKLI